MPLNKETKSKLSDLVWMVSILLIFSSPGNVSRFLETVPSVPNLTGITATFIFHNNIFFLTLWDLLSFLFAL